MSALSRTSRRPGTAVSSGFEHGRVSMAGPGIGLAPGLNEPTGFAIDLERVLAQVPGRVLPAEPYRPGSHTPRTRGRWPRSPFRLSSAARIWVRGRGRRR